MIKVWRTVTRSSMSAYVSALQVCQPFGISRRTRSTAAARHAAGAVRPRHSQGEHTVLETTSACLCAIDA